jgi:branched-chain amino acid transport system ATP-binding protein
MSLAVEPPPAPPTAAAPQVRPLLAVNNIEVVYADVILVLRGLSLAVPPGRSWRCSVPTAPASRRR